MTVASLVLNTEIFELVNTARIIGHVADEASLPFWRRLFVVRTIHSHVEVTLFEVPKKIVHALPLYVQPWMSNRSVKYS